MVIYCCCCEKFVEPRLTHGKEIYPHRKDLCSLPFWKCDECGNYVGCHHKTKTRTRPLGHIPTPELKTARSKIHAILDPLWKSGSISRKELYRQLTTVVGRNYHTANIKTIEEVNSVIDKLIEIRDQQ